ncbi:helix-turn-helix domain-containing protein [Anaeromyxobacter oryzisoli]|uniref:helix-turn-helix domain-containing protein n=1 Tax=Anaeromyxobacter oryzisoli TaxID=2925408 RepID=UPI001F5991D7|nr:helix-turn-helix transcriptional regulator [Anaeromyxobacter sp. SG63]
MSRKFQDFMREVETEALREGPRAVAELAEFDAHFRLAGQLLALRKARGLTQRQLSVKAGIQQSEISRIEAAHANPTMMTVFAIARALGAEVRLVPGKRRSPKAKADLRRAAASSARLVRRDR